MDSIGTRDLPIVNPQVKSVVLEDSLVSEHKKESVRDAEELQNGGYQYKPMVCQVIGVTQNISGVSLVKKREKS